MLHAKWIALYRIEYTRKDDLVNTIDKQVSARFVKIPAKLLRCSTGGEYPPKQMWRK